MKIPADQYWPVGKTGLRLPPIIFGAAPLANIPQVIPEQRKLELCGEWLQCVEPPTCIDVSYHDGDGLALETLGRMLRRLDISNDEVIIHLSLDSNRVAHDFDESCRLLGVPYRPRLLSIYLTNESDHNQWTSAHELKTAGNILGVGAILPDVICLQSVTPAVDWVVLTKGFSLLRHSQEILSALTELHTQSIPIIVADAFERGFLLGGNRLDGQVILHDDPANRSLLAWRTSFAALCQGHGITPAHACIQFTLSAPGVAAVLFTTSHPDRVAESVGYVQHQIPDAFWQSIQEEGLLAADYPFLNK